VRRTAPERIKRDAGARSLQVPSRAGVPERATASAPAAASTRLPHAGSAPWARGPPPERGAEPARPPYWPPAAGAATVTDPPTWCPPHPRCQPSSPARSTSDREAAPAPGVGTIADGLVVDVNRSRPGIIDIRQREHALRPALGQHRARLLSSAKFGPDRSAAPAPPLQPTRIGRPGSMPSPVVIPRPPPGVLSASGFPVAEFQNESAAPPT